MSIKKSIQGNSSLPKAFDELVRAVNAETLFSRVADIHRHVLRMELILHGKSVTRPKWGKKNDAYPEVPPPCQACKTNDFVIGHAKPSDLPTAQVVDGRDGVRCSDAKRDGHSAVSDPVG